MRRMLILTLMALAACRTGTDAGQAAATPSTNPDVLNPPFDAATHVLPAGDPDARNLPDDIRLIDPKPVSSLNPKAQRKYRLYGRLPAHMSMRIESRFRAYTPKQAGCREQLPLNSFGETHDVQFINVPIRHTSDRFEATLVIDRFKPGPCQWVYEGTIARLWQNSDPGDSSPADTYLVSTSFYHLPDDAPRCPRHATKCTEERARRLINSDGKPAYILCKIRPSIPRSDPPSFSCQDFNRDDFKKGHDLSPQTKGLEVQVYDLDREPDPFVSVTPSRQGE